jgi:hypothetical protein
MKSIVLSYKIIAEQVVESTCRAVPKNLAPVPNGKWALRFASRKKNQTGSDILRGKSENEYNN